MLLNSAPSPICRGQFGPSTSTTIYVADRKSSNACQVKLKVKTNKRNSVLVMALNGNSSGLGEKDGIVIVDHGSRMKESNSMLETFVDMYRKKTGHPIVEPAHMELARPTIKEAFDSCVGKGAARVIISPYFLSPGRHWQKDIPALAAEAAKDHPEVPYLVTAPIGLHPSMVDVIEDRIKYCLNHVAGNAPECDVCLGTGQCQQQTQ